MKKGIKALSILLILVLVFSSFLLVVSGAGSGYRKITVSYNGKKVMGGEALLIDSTTYVPFRAVCSALGDGGVEWDDKTKIASYVSDGLEIKARAGEYYIEANGRYFYCENGVKNVDSRIYVPIRPMAKAFGVNVEWDPSYKVKLTGGSALKAADNYYDPDDLYWLSRIISAESRGESLIGKIAVGNVVLNRVKNEYFPSTVYQVIFQSGQFSPVKSGTVYEAPTAESVIAAKICLEGDTVSEEILYFCNTAVAVNTWMQTSRRFVMRIGNHSFYA